MARKGNKKHGLGVTEDETTVPLFPQVEGAYNPIQPVVTAEDVDLLGERVDGVHVHDVKEGRIREVPVGLYQVVEFLLRSDGPERCPSHVPLQGQPSQLKLAFRIILAVDMGIEWLEGLARGNELGSTPRRSGVWIERDPGQVLLRTRYPGLDVHEVHGDRVRRFGSQLEPNVTGFTPHQVFLTGYQVVDPAVAAVQVIHGDPECHPVADRPAVDTLNLGFIILRVTDAQHPFRLSGRRGRNEINRSAVRVAPVKGPLGPTQHLQALDIKLIEVCRVTPGLVDTVEADRHARLPVPVKLANAADGDFLATQLRPKFRLGTANWMSYMSLIPLASRSPAPSTLEGRSHFLDRLCTLVGGDDDLFDQIILGWLRSRHPSPAGSGEYSCSDGHAQVFEQRLLSCSYSWNSLDFIDRQTKITYSHY